MVGRTGFIMEVVLPIMGAVVVGWVVVLTVPDAEDEPLEIGGTVNGALFGNEEDEEDCWKTGGTVSGEEELLDELDDEDEDDEEEVEVWKMGATVRGIPLFQLFPLLFALPLLFPLFQLLFELPNVGCTGFEPDDDPVTETPPAPLDSVVAEFCEVVVVVVEIIAELPVGPNTAFWRGSIVLQTPPLSTVPGRQTQVVLSGLTTVLALGEQSTHPSDPSGNFFWASPTLQELRQFPY